MATIVTQGKPSWQTQLATQILAPLVGNLINKAIERSENAYNNQRMQAALEANTPQPQATILGMSDNNPYQHSNNGWEDAFRQNNNLLAGFDANTANLASPMIAATQPAPARVPTLADMNAALIRNAGHASLPTLQAQFNPYMQAQEAARVEGLKRAAGEAIANATPENRVAELWRNLPLGYTTLADVNAAYGQYKDTWPQGGSLNTGDRTLFYDRNPQTGAITPQFSANMNLTPQQIADNDYRNRTFAEDARRFDKTMAYNAQTRDLTRADAQQPRVNQIITSGGKLYWIDQHGNTQPIMAGNTHLDAPQNVPANAFLLTQMEKLK